MSEIPIKAMKYDDANKDPHQFYPLTVPEAIIFPDGTNGKQAFDAVINDMSDVFSDQKPYEVGDYCIYNNVLYKFIAQKTAGAWDSSKASVTTIDAELKSLLNQINTLNSGIKLAIIGKSPQVIDNTDWNTLVDPGIYKIQCVVFSADKHAPIEVYNYGTLLVLKSAVQNEDRTVQIYIPDNNGNNYKLNTIAWRSRNSGAFRSWVYITGTQQS